MFEIKKNIPMPKPRGRQRYPFAEMEVGDCFDAPRDMGFIGSGKNHKDSQDRRKNTVMAAAYIYGKRHGVKFSCRIIDENTVRFWRVA